MNCQGGLLFEYVFDSRCAFPEHIIKCVMFDHWSIYKLLMIFHDRGSVIVDRRSIVASRVLRVLVIFLQISILIVRFIIPVDNRSYDEEFNNGVCFELNGRTVRGLNDQVRCAACWTSCCCSCWPLYELAFSLSITCILTRA